MTATLHSIPEYKTEITQDGEGFVLVGYRHTLPHTWKHDAGPIRFKTIQELGEWLKTNYK